MVSLLWCQGISPDELKDELPERQPRYPFLSDLERFLLVIRFLFMNPFVPKDTYFIWHENRMGGLLEKEGNSEGRWRDQCEQSTK